MSTNVRTILALRAAIGGESNSVTHLGIVCIWWNASHLYKRVPIYTRPAKEQYVGQGRHKCGTHILAITVGTYMDVMQTGNNQSILITGESGADRTKNTKKVISYCATICSSDQPDDGNLEKC